MLNTASIAADAPKVCPIFDFVETNCGIFSKTVLYPDDHIDEPLPHTRQLLRCVTSSYTAARPTSTYTSHSTAGQDPRSMFTTFQSPPINPPKPIRSQLRPPTQRRTDETTWTYFILSKVYYGILKAFDLSS